MKTDKVTRGPDNDADTTMAVLESHYVLGTAFTSYFLR